MNNDMPIPHQFQHMAKSACLLLLHPFEDKFAVCTRRGTTIDCFPGGKMDPGETMAQTAVRETSEEIGIFVDINTLQSLHADAILGAKDFWVESFVATSPTTDIKQMEEGIVSKWTTWPDFLQNNAFKEYNDGVYRAYQKWSKCLQENAAFVPDMSHLSVAPTAPEFDAPSM